MIWWLSAVLVLAAIVISWRLEKIEDPVFRQEMQRATFKSVGALALLGWIVAMLHGLGFF